MLKALKVWKVLALFVDFLRMPKKKKRHHSHIAELPPSSPSSGRRREVEVSNQGLTIRVQNDHAQKQQVAKEEEEEVVYMYSVSKKSLVEMVDLEVDGAEGLKEGARKFIVSGQDFPKKLDQNTSALLKNLGKREISVTCKGDISIAIGGNPVPASSNPKSRKRKHSSTDTICCICQVDYELLTAAGNELLLAGCGHLFCTLCLQSLGSCVQCNCQIAKLWKIYL